ncbi:MAG: DUF6691 family protein [Alphaproteobacteria bacterium]
MSKIISAFAIGILFGIGLTIAQMVNPAKVLSFLDLAGNWDPSLAFVMGGGAGVAALGYRFVLRRRRPILAEMFQVPTRTDLDARLLLGAGLFGVGWGIAGLCPGPALAVLGLGRSEAVIFALAMAGGFTLFEIYNRALMKSK